MSCFLKFYLFLLLYSSLHTIEKLMKILIAGGLGFIGINFIIFALKKDIKLLM